MLENLDIMTIIRNICIWTLPVLFAITVHEVAHGWVAEKFGDSTARMMGRLTLNPFKHIDIVGTVIVPLLFLIAPGGFMFGWAKPVPVSTRYFKHPRRDMAIVAVAGPLVNLLMAFIWAAIGKLAIVLLMSTKISGFKFFAYMGQAGVMINLMLMLLNLIPMPPLDGGRVLAAFLPSRAADVLDRLEPYGFFILIALIFTGVLSALLTAPFLFLSNFIHSLFFA